MPPLRPPARARRPALARASVAAAAYTVVTVAMTWPLSRALGKNVAWDLGDSLLNMWILGWDATALAAILRGDLTRISTFFDANIFFPEPLTLAYSEHLFAQAVQILPLYLATDNPILCYNVLFLSTFVLSGLGAYLLVRELTGDARAAFIAGLLFAFAPYRLAQSAHLQVLSAQWMPFTLYGLRRYFDTRRRRPLAGAAVALVAQSLSCGYFLLYFTPFVVVYALWEIAVRSAWRDRRLWTDLTVAGAAAAAVMLPFVLPYFAVRQRLGVGRDPAEVARFSADVYGYLTSSVHSRVWGPIAQAFNRAEGELFPGLIPTVMGAAGVGAWVTTAAARARDAFSTVHARTPRKDRPWIAGAGGLVALAAIAFAVILVFERRLTIDVWIATVRAADVTRPLLIGIAALAVAAWASRWIRALLIALIRSPEAFLLMMLVGAWWLSLGPEPTALGRPLRIAAPYAFLYEHIPGFEGIRVPARMAMIGSLALAVLAGFGLHAVGSRRWSGAVLAVVGVAFLAEATTVPFLVNGMSPLRDHATPEARVYRPARAPQVYAAAARLPPDAVLIEFPFGHPDYDLRAVYYSTAHWKRLVNGYSGYFPPSFSRKAGWFTDISRHPEPSRQALKETGATHAIVHEAAYLDGEGLRVSEWLRASGAEEQFRDGSDALFRLAR